MMASEKIKSITLEVGTIINAYGSVYQLRFSAKFYPSKDEADRGMMIDRWGNRSFISIVMPVFPDGGGNDNYTN